MIRDKSPKNIQHNYRPEEQQRRDADARRSTLLLVIDHVRRQELGTVGLVKLANEMGLDSELDEMAVSSPEHQQTIDLVRRQLGLGDVADDANLDADG